MEKVGDGDTGLGRPRPSSGLPKEESPRHAAFSQRRSLESPSLSHVTAISTKSLQHIPTTVMSMDLFSLQDSSLLVGFLVMNLDLK